VKYGSKDVKALPTKEIDITEFFTNPGGKIKLKIRHYSQYEAHEINALLLQGQSFKRGTEDEGEVNLKKFHMAEAFLARLKAGVVMDDDFPFEKWDDEFIQELDRINPEMTGYIHDQIQEYNRPFEKKKERKSNG